MVDKMSNSFRIRSSRKRNSGAFGSCFKPERTEIEYFKIREQSHFLGCDILNIRKLDFMLFALERAVPVLVDYPSVCNKQSVQIIKRKIVSDNQKKYY